MTERPLLGEAHVVPGGDVPGLIVEERRGLASQGVDKAAIQGPIGTGRIIVLQAASRHFASCQTEFESAVAAVGCHPLGGEFGDPFTGCRPP